MSCQMLSVPLKPWEKPYHKNPTMAFGVPLAQEARET